MDTLSHGLWAAVAAKAANKILKGRGRETRVNPWWAGFWGVFPDVLAFTPLFFWVLARIVTGAFNVNDFVSGTSGNQAMFPISQLTGVLYNFSHSSIVFAAVFVLAWLIFRRPAWAVGGWLLHLLMDIPTHPASFYPTPLLWPFFELHIGGISWATPTFLIANYTVLGILLCLLHEKEPQPAEPVSPRTRTFRIIRNVVFAAFVVVIAFSIYAALYARRGQEPPLATGNPAANANIIVTATQPGATAEVFEYSAKDGEEINKVSMPIVFEKDPPSQTVKVYFSSRTEDPEATECNKTYPAPRRIPKTSAPARASLEELLKGPNRAEADKGFFTSINPGVKINSLAVANGIAHVDFDATMEAGMGGSCRVAAIRSQIANTLKQFPSVRDVVIGVEGRVEDALQP